MGFVEWLFYYLPREYLTMHQLWMVLKGGVIVVVALFGWSFTSDAKMSCLDGDVDSCEITMIDVPPTAQ